MDEPFDWEKHEQWVLEILSRIAEDLQHHGTQMNERYLHHAFSHIVQSRFKVLKGDPDDELVFHTEWPTYRKTMGPYYGGYGKTEDGYKPIDGGSSGFVDFTLGSFDCPSIGIEFCFGSGWEHERAIFDFIKIMDGRLPFKSGICWIVIQRYSNMGENGRQARFLKRVNEAVMEVIRRLGKGIDYRNSHIHIIITEVFLDVQKRHWHYDFNKKRIVTGWPI